MSVLLLLSFKLLVVFIITISCSVLACVLGSNRQLSCNTFFKMFTIRCYTLLLVLLYKFIIILQNFISRWLMSGGRRRGWRCGCCWFTRNLNARDSSNLDILLSFSSSTQFTNLFKDRQAFTRIEIFKFSSFLHECFKYILILSCHLCL